MASNNCSSAVPVNSLSERLTILELNSILSPSLKNLGAFGCTISSFCVTISLVLLPKAASLVCASAMNFHLVSASGMVKENSILPVLSVLRSGKKKAVSLKFLRILTSLPCVCLFIGCSSNRTIESSLTSNPETLPVNAGWIFATSFACVIVSADTELIPLKVIR